MSFLRVAGPAFAGLAIVVLAFVLLAVVMRDGDTSFVDLEVGDCFDLPDADEGDGSIGVFAVELIDCDEPHDVEVVAVGNLREQGDDAAEEYPGFEAADEAAAASCALVAVDSARVGVVPVAPTEQTWSSFDGRYVCLALAVGGGPLVGPVTEGSPLDG